MKKILLSTALLSATAGMAAAEVTFSGYGRFGLTYEEGADVETQIAMRLRFNINAKTETDSGVTFGGRIRMQYTNGSTAAALSPAYVYAEYEGVRIEVGNANTAYDSAALMYDSEMGFLDSSAGDPLGLFYGFSSGAYGDGFDADATADANRMGIFASYSVGDFNVRASYVTPDQTASDLEAGLSEELSVSADYKFGAVTVSAGVLQSGLGVEDNDEVFLGAAYAFNDAGNVGLNYFKNDGIDTSLVTLYGNYKFNAITARAYVAFLDGDLADTLSEDTAFGIGADYDLGGARLSGAIQQGFTGDMVADLGVRFDF